MSLRLCARIRCHSLACVDAVLSSMFSFVKEMAMGGFEYSTHAHPPPRHRHDDMRNCLWQERVVDMVVSRGASVFISGMAGSGKTFVLERIIRMLKSKHGVKFLLILHLAESINHFIIQRFNQSH